MVFLVERLKEVVLWTLSARPITQMNNAINNTNFLYKTSLTK
jgi:hypothetical protein